MKLLLCNECQDVRKLLREPTYCKCGKSGGKYLSDGLRAEYWGEHCVMLGFSNHSLVTALVSQRELGDHSDGMGRRFTAFVIPEGAPTVKRVNEL